MSVLRTAAAEAASDGKLSSRHGIANEAMAVPLVNSNPLLVSHILSAPSQPSISPGNQLPRRSEAKGGQRARVFASKGTGGEPKASTAMDGTKKMARTKSFQGTADQKDLADFLDSLAKESEDKKTVPPHLIPVHFVGRMFLAADGVQYKNGRKLKKDLQKEVEGESIRLREDREQLRAMEGCYMGFFSAHEMAEKSRDYIEDLQSLTKTEISHEDIIHLVHDAQFGTYWRAVNKLSKEDAEVAADYRELARKWRSWNSAMSKKAAALQLMW